MPLLISRSNLVALVQTETELKANESWERTNSVGSGRNRWIFGKKNTLLCSHNFDFLAIETIVRRTD